MRVANALLAAFIAAILILAGYGLMAIADVPVYAKAQQEEGTCVQFAKVGMWDVYHCIDPTGNEFIGNSAGMLISVGN